MKQKSLWQLLVALVLTTNVLSLADALAAEFKTGDRVMQKDPDPRVAIALCHKVDLIGEEVMMVIPPSGYYQDRAQPVRVKDWRKCEPVWLADFWNEHDKRAAEEPEE